MKIWIDITNSPHVLFFEPIIKHLKEKGHEILVTARDYQQTIPLLIDKKIPFISLGKHHGKKRFSKILGGILEIQRRIKFIEEYKPDLILSHQAFYATIAARIKRKKSLYIFDGDGAFLQVLGIYFASKTMCPEQLPKKIGGISLKIRYPGIKEEVYLYNKKINKNYLEKLGLKRKKYNILIRPEAGSASYIKEENILDPLLKELETQKDIQTIIIPRNPLQKEHYKKNFKKVIIFEKLISGPDLIANVDLVLSGGGTMNRESVALGTPTISAFQNKPLSIDKWLVKKGYMHLITKPTINDVKKVLKSKGKYKMSDKGNQKIIKIIENMLNEK